MSAVTEIAPLVGIVLACAMLAVARATYYRSRRPRALPPPRPTPPRALGAGERQKLRQTLRENAPEWRYETPKKDGSTDMKEQWHKSWCADGLSVADRVRALGRDLQEYDVLYRDSSNYTHPTSRLGRTTSDENDFVHNMAVRLALAAQFALQALMILCQAFDVPFDGQGMDLLARDVIGPFIVQAQKLVAS